VDAVAHADVILTAEVRRLLQRTTREADFVRRADSLIERMSPLPLIYLGQALRALLDRLVTGVNQSGWCPEELGELLRRDGGAERLPALGWLLTNDLRRAPLPGAPWRAQVEALGKPEPLTGHSVDTLAGGLRLAVLLAGLPEVAATLSRTASSAAPVEPIDEEARAKLAKVRALLAKAESTMYDEEAEALTAKAQELISRYALERLLERDASAGSDTASAGVAVRRLWLDAPYVLAKAHLVDAVASANRCRVVVSERLSMCTVLGDPPDLDAVELLVTSLLVQSTHAMVGHGRHVDLAGVSRTRSFRQSFLVSYAARIGERLNQATADLVDESGESTTWLPVLRDAEQRVSEAFEELFPEVQHVATTVSNGAGWYAGRTAADLAQLDVQPKLTAKG
jgi:hypothetical protein